MKINTVKGIKELIDKEILPGYTYKTNFSNAGFLVYINHRLVIAAKLVKHNDRMEYEFILDTQFLSNDEITYEELKMIIRIIRILEENKKFVLSKLKKYTVEEYEKEIEYRKNQSEMMMNALMEAIKSKNNFELY